MPHGMYIFVPFYRFSYLIIFLGSFVRTFERFFRFERSGPCLESNKALECSLQRELQLAAT